MNREVSICIPTYRRPSLVVQAIQSCFANDMHELEIIIGDDSRDSETERALLDLKHPPGVEIRYIQNLERLGQPRNVNSLFDSVSNDRLILLHDDDRLIPGSIDLFCDIWARHRDMLAVYGKQHIIDMNGNRLPIATEEENNARFRTSNLAGVQASTISSALLGQFPNDAYMIDTAAARSVRYGEYSFRGDGSDYDFGVRVALQHRDMNLYFINDFTAEYRFSDECISTESLGASYLYQMLSGLELPASEEPALDHALSRLAPFAVPMLARRGKRRDALHTYLSRHYSTSRLSPKGLYHLSSILVPQVTKIRDKYKRGRGARDRKIAEDRRG